jgi:hypothetical protein
MAIDVTTLNLYFAVYREICECSYPWFYDPDYQNNFEFGYEEPVLSSTVYTPASPLALFVFSSAQTATLCPTNINRGWGRYRYFLLELLPDGVDSIALQSGVLLVYNAPAWPPTATPTLQTIHYF